MLLAVSERISAAGVALLVLVGGGVVLEERHREGALDRRRRRGALAGTAARARPERRIAPGVHGAAPGGLASRSRSTKPSSTLRSLASAALSIRGCSACRRRSIASSRGRAVGRARWRPAHRHRPEAAHAAVAGLGRSPRQGPASLSRKATPVRLASALARRCTSMKRMAALLAQNMHPSSVVPTPDPAARFKFGLL